jgi:uncharacterized protein DUF3467
MEQPTTKQLDNAKTADFVSRYTNNVRFERTVWDLKFVFGQLDQSTPGETATQQHTAVSMAWSEAKVVAYLLLTQLELYQAEYGQIRLPLSVIPPRPNSSDPALTDLAAKKVVEYLAVVHDQFFSGSPYVPPAVAELVTPTGENP